MVSVLKMPTPFYIFPLLGVNCTNGRCVKDAGTILRVLPSRRGLYQSTSLLKMPAPFYVFLPLDVGCTNDRRVKDAGTILRLPSSRRGLYQ